MDIGSAEYLAAAKDSLDAAGKLHREGLYTTAHYLCGLSVECILRAYRWKLQTPWDGRHNIQLLFKESQFDQLIPSKRYKEFDEAFQYVVLSWSNSHRYMSAPRLEKYLNTASMIRNIRGHKIKAHSAQMLSYTLTIVDLGVAKWKN